MTPALITASDWAAERCAIEDEEFPADLPVNYDWMLQPASQPNAKRVTSIVTLLLAAFLIAVSVLMIHKLSNSSPAVLASPSSPLD
ncbi:MAG: hypothetical protein WA477_12650 [Candidatus Sulfotelmatobacter sp.]